MNSVCCLETASEVTKKVFTKCFFLNKSTSSNHRWRKLRQLDLNKKVILIYTLFIWKISAKNFVKIFYLILLVSFCLGIVIFSPIQTKGGLDSENVAK